VAVFAGRFVRFGVLSALVLWFGPQILELLGSMFKRHWVIGLAAVVSGLAVWFALWVRGRAAKPETSD
jgi:hypothetical protein